MRKMKYVIGFLMLFMIIGFASVSISLGLGGNAMIMSDLDDFKVYFSDIKVNDKHNWTIVHDETSVEFDIKLYDIGKTYKVTYDITNASKVFDAALNVTCTQGDSRILIENDFDSSNLPALTTRTGNLIIKKLTSNASETNTSYQIRCDIIATPVERGSSGTGEVPIPIIREYATLKATDLTDRTAFRSATYKEKIKTINFEGEINVPEDAIESWDISEDETESIIAYVITNEENPEYYDLYIQARDKMYANEDMTYWFRDFTYVDEINGLELLDTSKTTNMSAMFWGTGFYSEIIELDLSNFDTSNVTDMGAMFSGFAYSNTNAKLDLSNFDTSNVTDMGSMFEQFGYNNPNFVLDLSNFDTSKVTYMGNMFVNMGYNSTNITLDISSFNTSNVTSMFGMFRNLGYNSTNITLDVSHFDTSNVTNMSSMFKNTGYKSTKLKTSITIKNPNITNYNGMFEGVATKTGSKITVNYTNETSDLVDQMISTKSSNSNVVKGYNIDIPITFTIDGTTHNAYEGMTWEQWVDSNFNPNSQWKIVNANEIDSSWGNGSYIVCFDALKTENVLFDEISKELYNEVIVADQIYYKGGIPMAVNPT